MEEIAYIGGKYKPLNKNKINDVILNGESLIKNKVVDLTSTIDDIKNSIDNDVFVIVDALPTENIKSKIYCVLDSTGGGTDNKYIEWVYTNDAWEKVGEFQATPNLDTKVSKTGDTMTGKLSVPYIETGTNANNYFQCQKFRGEGDASKYYHAIDFGYLHHDQVDFYEYGAIWNFWKGAITAASSVKVGAITSTGWNGPAVLTGTPTAPTASVGTNTTQIATTAFVTTAGTNTLSSAKSYSDTNLTTAKSYTDTSITNLFWSGTLTEYNALTDKTQYKMYIIEEDA